MNSSLFYITLKNVLHLKELSFLTSRTLEENLRYCGAVMGRRSAQIRCRKGKLEFVSRQIRNKIKRKINETKTLLHRKPVNSKNNTGIWKTIYRILGSLASLPLLAKSTYFSIILLNVSQGNHLLNS